MEEKRRVRRKKKGSFRPELGIEIIWKTPKHQKGVAWRKDDGGKKRDTQLFTDAY